MTPSDRFADARSSLLSDAAWDGSREDTCRALSLPTSPDVFIEQLAGELDDAYQRTREGLTPDHAIHALAARGELPVDRLDALPEPASLTTLRAGVDALMPPADLPDLVLEIAAKTEFLHAFTNDHEPNAQLRDLEISLCAVLVAHACNVGYRPLVDDSNPALRESRLRYVAQRYLRGYLRETSWADPATARALARGVRCAGDDEGRTSAAHPRNCQPTRTNRCGQAGFPMAGSRSHEPPRANLARRHGLAMTRQRLPRGRPRGEGRAGAALQRRRVVAVPLKLARALSAATLSNVDRRWISSSTPRPPATCTSTPSSAPRRSRSRSSASATTWGAVNEAVTRGK